MDVAASSCWFSAAFCERTFWPDPEKKFDRKPNTRAPIFDKNVNIRTIKLGSFSIQAQFIEIWERRDSLDSHVLLTKNYVKLPTRFWFPLFDNFIFLYPSNAHWIFVIFFHPFLLVLIIFCQSQFFLDIFRFPFTHMSVCNCLWFQAQPFSCCFCLSPSLLNSPA